MLCVRRQADRSEERGGLGLEPEPLTSGRGEEPRWHAGGRQEGRPGLREDVGPETDSDDRRHHVPNERTRIDERLLFIKVLTYLLFTGKKLERLTKRGLKCFLSQTIQPISSLLTQHSW